MGKTLSFLNIEDSKRDAALLTRHLSTAGYDLITERVDTAGAMRAALKGREWDIILCDYSMPDFNALSALAVLRESGLDIPFIIISGTVGEDVAVEAMLTGANDYLAKDNLMRLVPAIERELREAENRRGRRRAENERRIISEIIQGAVTAPNLDEFLKLVHRSISQVVYAENCFVMLHDAATDMFRFEFWVDSRDPQPQPCATGFASYVMRTGVPLRLNKESKKKLQEQGEAEQIGSVSASWLVVPLRTPSRPIGVLVLQHYEDEHAYSERDLEFLTSVGDQIALAIDRKRAEEYLRESEERFRSVVETASDAIINIDETSTIIFANTAAENIFGYSLDEMMGEKLAMLMPERLRPSHNAGIGNYLETGHKHLSWDHLELPGLHRDGREIPLDLSFAEFTQDGRRYFTGIVSDVTERKRADDKLRESESLLAASQRITHLGSWVVDLTGSDNSDENEVRWSDEHYRIFGFEPGQVEVSSKTFYNSVHPEDRTRVDEELREAIEQRRPYDIEYRIILPDGGERIVQGRAEIVFDKNTGKPIKLLGSVQDITEHKQAEKALRESEERYRELVENATDIMYTLDLKGNFTSINRAAEKITGYTQEESQTLSTTRLVAPEYREIAAQNIAARLAGKDVSGYEIDIIAKDGRRIALDVNTRIIYANAVPIGVQGIARDITDRKQVESALKLSEFSVRQASVPTFWIARDARILRVNNAACELLGYTEAELLTRSITDLDPDFTKERWPSHWQELRDLGRMLFETRQIHKNGHIIPIEVDLNWFEFEGREYNFAFIRDITERKRADEELRESEQKYRTILENIEDGYFEVDVAGNLTFFNNSLCGILGYSRKELLGMNNRTFMDEQNAGKVYQTFNKVHRTGKPANAFDWEI
ncbi:MAG: PAS domain S-box protein, partial [Pyrinomonadaceae bacterium]